MTIQRKGNVFSDQEKKTILSDLVSLIQTGDILLRSSNAKFHGIPFSILVQLLTNSQYSHASLALKTVDTIALIEISDDGTQIMNLPEWLDYALNRRLTILRLKNPPEEFNIKIQKEIEKFVSWAPEYDFTFQHSDKFYCTESVIYIYEQLGIKLCEGHTPDEVLPWWAKPFFYIGNFIVGTFTKGKIPLDQKLYFVGNKKQGILSSDVLKPIYEI